MGILRRIGRHEDWRIAEALMAWASVLYGAWLMIPGNTFETGPTTRFIAAFGLPDWAWGLGFIATGLLRALAVSRRNHSARRIGALVDVWKWLLFWLLLVAASPLAAFPTFCLAFAVGSGLSYIAAVNCEVVGGVCNGLLEHRVIVLAEKLASASGRPEGP